MLLPLLLAAIAMVTGLASLGPFFVYLVALGGGFLAPDFWLGKQIKKRQKKLTRGLPDVLDLLVICMEAGLSLDQATSRCAEELRDSQPEICDELRLVVLEQRAGRARSEAWKNMADRTGVDSLRNLVSMLVQTEQFGTSIAKMLRVHSDTLRMQRVQMVEEMAGEDLSQASVPAGAVHFSCAISGYTGTSRDRDGGVVPVTDQIIEAGRGKQHGSNIDYQMGCRSFGSRYSDYSDSAPPDASEVKAGALVAVAAGNGSRSHGWAGKIPLSGWHAAKTANARVGGPGSGDR